MRIILLCDCVTNLTVARLNTLVSLFQILKTLYLLQENNGSLLNPNKIILPSLSKSLFISIEIMKIALAGTTGFLGRHVLKQKAGKSYLMNTSKINLSQWE